MFLVLFLILVELPARLVGGAHLLVRRAAGRPGPNPWEPWVYRALGGCLVFAALVALLAVTGT